MTVEIYTDGGCIGNPGPGAWAFVIALPDTPIEQFGYNPNTTNNRMELQAIIEALSYLTQHGKTGTSYVIHTDSLYVQKGISQWIISWKCNNWKTAAKKAVKNKDLWLELDKLNNSLKPQWKWVKGHAGIELNERCDFLVKQCVALQNI